MRFHKQHSHYFAGCNPDMLELGIGIVCEDYEEGIYSFSISFAWFYIGLRIRIKTRFLGVFRPREV